MPVPLKHLGTVLSHCRTACVVQISRSTYPGRSAIEDDVVTKASAQLLVTSENHVQSLDDGYAVRTLVQGQYLAPILIVNNISLL